MLLVPPKPWEFAMGIKTKHHRGTPAPVGRRSASSVSQLISGHNWLALIISLSPEKIRALGTFFLCVAMTLRILTMPSGVHEGASMPSWEEITIIAGLCSIVVRRRTKVRT